MAEMENFIIRILNCCTGEGRQVSQLSDYDPNLLSIELCLDNSCQNDPPNSIALISSSPNMPQITFRVFYYGDTLCSPIQAELRVTFKRNTAVQSRNRMDSIQVFIPDIEMNFDYTFNTEEEIQGGRAEIILWDQYDTKIKSFKFTIKGQNPSARDVYDYIDEMNYSDDFWFLKRISTHENGAHPQSLESRLWQFNEYNSTTEDLQNNWDASSRCPNLSGNRDGGWGLTQLTEPKPDKMALWSWKDNIDDANTLLIDKADDLDGIVDDWCDIIALWNTNNPSDPASGHAPYEHSGITWVHALNEVYDGIVDIETHFPDTLVNEEKSFLDAMIIKYFNGNGAGNDDHIFYYLVHPSNQKPSWNIDPSATYGGGTNYYVRDIAQTIVPAF
jgi:hypothetical protein